MSVICLTWGMHTSNAMQSFKGSIAKFKANTGSKEKGMYSFGSALGVTLLLTVFLWWLPVFGQMIAGYVGGRRSGSALKGFLATLSAVMSFAAVALLISVLGFSIADGQNAILDTVAGSFPAFGDLLTSMFAYIEGFFSNFGEFGAAALSIILITVMFGTIGGMMTAQRAKESNRSPMSTSVHANARSMEAHKTGRSQAFGSFDDYLPVNAVQTVRTEGTAKKKPLVRKASARDAPQEVEEPEPEFNSPLSSVLTMSDRTPVKEKQVQPKDDFEYI